MSAPRLSRILLGVTAALLLALSVSALWLLRADAGRDWTLTRLRAQLPVGAELRMDSVSGTLSGPLDVRGLHYRDDARQVDIGHVHLAHALWPLLRGRLDIDALVLEDVQVRLAPERSPTKMPSWPDLLPRLALPLTIAVADLRVRELLVWRAGVPQLHASRVDGAFTVGAGALQIDRLALDSDRGTLTLAGEYRPRDRFRTRLDAQAQLRLASQGDPVPATLIVRGDLGTAQLRLETKAPAALLLTAGLRDGDGARPAWQLQAHSAGLVPAALGIADDVSWRGDLQIAGDGGRARVQGQLQRGDLAAAIAPSLLVVQGATLQLSPLALTLPAGNVRADGQVTLAGAASTLALTLRSEALRLTPVEPGRAVVTGAGALQLQGRFDAWRAQGQAHLQRAREVATVQVTAHGDRAQAVITALQVASPRGRLDGSGAIAWSPRLDLRAQATLAGFDPGYFLPDYPGAVDGELQLHAARDARQGWIGEARLARLGGRWRDRPVAGEAQANWDGVAGAGHLRLQVGHSRLSAQGQIGERLDLQAKFDPLELSDLIAGAHGRVQGTLSVQGLRAQPACRGDLRGEGLAWNGDRVAHARVQGGLAGAGTTGSVQLVAGGVQLAGQALTSVDVTLRGSVRDWQARATLVAASGQAQLQLHALRDRDGWRGTLGQLRLVPALGAAWTLRAPAAYRATERFMPTALAPACLAAAAPGGAVCLAFDGRRASLHGQALPLALLQPWLDRQQAGVVVFGALDADAGLQRDDRGRWNGTFALRSSHGGLRLPEAAAPRDIASYDGFTLDGTLRADALALTLDARLPAQGHVHGQLQTALAADAPLAGTLELDLRDLGWLELFSIDLAQPTGELAGTLRLGGRRDAPRLEGQARLQQFRADLPALNVGLSEGDLRLFGDASGALQVAGSVRAGAGTLHVDGDYVPTRTPTPLQLQLHGEGITAADTPDLEATISPALALAYGNGQMSIRGDVVVPRARVNLERLDAGVSASPDVVVLDPRATAGATGLLQVDTDVDVRLGQDVHLQGFGLDGVLGGALHVRDRPGRAASATGSLGVSGTYVAYGQTLRITQGRLDYSNAGFDDPVLDLRAERQIEDVTVGVRVRGRASAPETSVTSTPAMETTEALSWLMFGRPLSTASGEQTRTLNASALALGAGGNLLAHQVGTRLGLDEAGVVDSRALGGAALAIGKRISPRLFVSYGLSLLGTGQVITLKYLIRQGLDVSLESGAETSAAVHWRKEK